jgi:hypothetical protein
MDRLLRVCFSFLSSPEAGLTIRELTTRKVNTLGLTLVTGSVTSGTVGESLVSSVEIQVTDCVIASNVTCVKNRKFSNQRKQVEFDVKF